jgi:hypothetical protein
VKTEELRVTFARSERQFKPKTHTRLIKLLISRKMLFSTQKYMVRKSCWILKQIHRFANYEESFKNTFLPLPTETGKVHTNVSQAFYMTCIRPVIECVLFFTTPYIINKRISRKLAETTPLQIIHQIVSYTDILVKAGVDTSFDGSSNVTVNDHDQMY